MTMTQTQAQTERTAGPWSVEMAEETASPFATITSKADGNVAYLTLHPSRVEANARFIVTACNAHDELVAALRNSNSLLNAWQAQHPDDAILAACIVENRAALAKVDSAQQGIGRAA